MDRWVHIVFSLLNYQFLILHSYLLYYLFAGILEFPVDLSGLDIFELILEGLFEMFNESSDGPYPPISNFFIFLNDGSDTARSMNHLEL